MFKRIVNPIVVFFREETFKERSQRMLPAILFGLIAGSAYVLVLSTINVLTLPALHLRIDWTRLLLNLVKYDLALTLIGALAGWFTEDYAGAIGGGIVTLLLYLLGNWMVFRIVGASPQRIVNLLITAIPLLIGFMLVCSLFRLVVGRFFRIEQSTPPERRTGQKVGLVLIVILVGMLPGFFSRFDQNAQKVVLSMDQRLQAVATDPSLLSQFPLTQFPDLQRHFGTPFTLYPRPSSSVASSLDVTIRYSDGYALTCLVSTADPYVQYFKQCFPGNNVNLP